jgi:uncharacterized LabA/DUF88 family protein
MDETAVHLFWDNSNLFARMQDTCDDRKDGTGLEAGRRLDARLNFRNIFEFARAERTVEKAVAVGSVPPGLMALWEKLGKVGMIVGLQERGAESGKEQAVDEALALEMLTSLVDREQPAVAVLLSGDGGFRPYVDRLLKKGWGVEVCCFSKGFSSKLTRIATGSGGRGKYVRLDPWYFQLTYLQQLRIDGIPELTRPSEPLDLRGRPKV